MIRRFRALILAGAAFGALVGGAAQATEVQLNQPIYVTAGTRSGTAVTGVTATGAIQNSGASIYGGSYVHSCVAAAWNSATVTLQVQAPDGVSWFGVATGLTANGQQGVVLGQGDVIRENVTGGTPTTLACLLK